MSSSEDEEMEEDSWSDGDDGVFEEMDEFDEEDGNVNNSNDEKPEPRVWYFPCKMWLDSGMSDGSTERELVSAPEPQPDEGK